MLTTSSPARSVAEKYRRELKTEDFVLISQENKQYKQLIKVLQEREGILSLRVAELERVNGRLQNQRDEYKAISNELGIRLQQYESIKDELLSQYKILKKQIDRSLTAIAEKQSQVSELRRVNDGLQESVVVLEQNARTDAMVIEELRGHVGKLERELVDKKIKIFSQLVQCAPREQCEKGTTGKKENQMERGNKTQSNNASFKTSYGYQNSKNSSNTNSISFSLVSNESASRKASRVKKHNKPIYI